MTESLVTAMRKNIVEKFIEPMLKIPHVEKGEVTMPGWHCDFSREDMKYEDAGKNDDILSCTLWSKAGTRCIVRVPLDAVYPSWDADAVVVDSFFLAGGWRDMPAGYASYIRCVIDLWFGGLMRAA